MIKLNRNYNKTSQKVNNFYDNQKKHIRKWQRNGWWKHTYAKKGQKNAPPPEKRADRWPGRGNKRGGQLFEQTPAEDDGKRFELSRDPLPASFDVTELGDDAVCDLMRDVNRLSLSFILTLVGGESICEKGGVEF